MKKLLITISLVLVTNITYFSEVVALESPGPPPGAYGAAGVGPKEIQEGDKLHLCIQGEADAALFHPYEENSDKGVIITLERAGTDLFQAGQRLSIANGGKSDEITLRNRENGPFFTNAHLVYIQNTYDILSSKKILNVFDRHDDFDPYIDYESENSTHLPCKKNRPPTMDSFVPSIYKIKAESFLLRVTEVSDSENSDQATEDGFTEEVQPSAPIEPVSNGNDGLLNNDNNNSAAPANGGCGCSVTSTIPGMNYSLSILFALTVGAHALLRFRKQ